MEDKIKELLVFGLRTIESKGIKTEPEKIKYLLWPSKDWYKQNLKLRAYCTITVFIEDGHPVKTIYRPGCESVTGYTSEEFTSNPFLWIQIVPEEDRPKVQNYVSSILTGKEMSPIEHRIIRKDSSVCWIRNATILHFDNNGKLLSYDCLIEDITEQKQAEESLRMERDKAQSYLDIAGVILVVIDAKGDVTLINKKGCEILGYTQEEIVGKNWFENFLPERVRADVKEVARKLLAGDIKPVEYYENPVLTKSGEERIIAWHNTVLRDKEGKIIAHLSSGEDVTDRELKDAKLNEAEKKYRGLYESVIDGIVMTDVQGRILECNKAYRDMLGYTEEEIKKLTYQQMTPEKWHKMEEDIVKNQILARGYSDEYEKEYIKKDGTVFPISIRVWSINNEEGKPVGMWGFVRDITDRKQAENEREALYKELLKSNKKLRQAVLKDSYTGLYNYRYLQEIIDMEFHRAKRHALPLSLIMLDIDYFKSINDVYGYKFGDSVLKQLARQLKKIIRRCDIPIRSGGEEFVIISPATNRSEALVLAQRLFDALSLYDFGDKRHTVKLKLSLVVATYPDDKITKGADLINLAVKILNKAKEYGGNKVYSSIDIEKEKPLIEKEKKANVTLLKRKIEKLTKQTQENLIEAVFAFAKTIKLKDHYTGEHAERTVYYATEVTRKLGLSKEEIERVRIASILHDLGKIGINEKVLLKKSRLTKKEFEVIKKHPQIGADIIRPIQFLHDVIPLIFYHHERWNGKGYPSGLKAEEIPLGARIIAIADVYQALISDRPYRKAYSKKKAIRIIKDGSGTQFDPKIVDIFLRILQKEL